MTVLFLLFEKQVCSGKKERGYIFSAALSITTIECGAGSERLLTAIKLFLRIFPRVVAILDFESRGRLSSRAALFCTRTQQLPTLLGQQCWELLRPC